MPKEKQSNSSNGSHPALSHRPFTRQCKRAVRAKVEAMRKSLASKCRFCMKEGKLVIYDIVPNGPGEDGLLEKIKSVLHLDLLAERTETSPDKICPSCLSMITTLYEFKLRSHNVQNILNRQVNGKNCRPG